jgi:sterol 24-C-methyltransferase
MAPGALLPEETTSDVAFSKAMHGKSAETQNSYASMLRKDHEAHRLITEEDLKRWEEDQNGDNSEEAREKRKGEYMSLVNK